MADWTIKGAYAGAKRPARPARELTRRKLARALDRLKQPSRPRLDREMAKLKPVPLEL
jgi:hypothetical protein